MTKYIILASLGVIFMACSTKELNQARQKIDDVQESRVKYLQDSNTRYQNDITRILEQSVNHLGEAAKNKPEVKNIYIEPVSKYIQPGPRPSNYQDNDYLIKSFNKIKYNYSNFINKY